MNEFVYLIRKEPGHENCVCVISLQLIQGSAFTPGSGASNLANLAFVDLIILMALTTFSWAIRNSSDGAKPKKTSHISRPGNPDRGQLNKIKYLKRFKTYK